jgi:hypothetical protein
MNDRFPQEQIRGRRGHTCPACGTALLVGGIALGPLCAGLCPACHLVSFWAEPSEALHAAIQLYRTEQA